MRRCDISCILPGLSRHPEDNSWSVVSQLYSYHNISRSSDVLSVLKSYEKPQLVEYGTVEDLTSKQIVGFRVAPDS